MVRPPIVVAIRPPVQPGLGSAPFGIRARSLPTTSGFPYAGIEPGISCRRRSGMKRILIGALVISCAMVMAAGDATKAAGPHPGAAKNVTGSVDKGEETNNVKVNDRICRGEWGGRGAAAPLA